MVIFISGSINSGKTTTAKALAHKLGARFIDIDDVNDRIPNFDLSKDISKGIALAIEDINKLTDAGQSKRGDRGLTEWGVARIKHHYYTGIATPSFGKIIDNSDLSIDETVSAIEELVKQ